MDIFYCLFVIKYTFMHIYFFRRNVTILNNTAVYAQRFTIFSNLRRLFSFFAAIAKWRRAEYMDLFFYIWNSNRLFMYIFYIRHFTKTTGEQKTADVVSFFAASAVMDISVLFFVYNVICIAFPYFAQGFGKGITSCASRICQRPPVKSGITTGAPA